MSAPVNAITSAHSTTSTPTHAEKSVTTNISKVVVDRLEEAAEQKKKEMEKTADRADANAKEAKENAKLISGPGHKQSKENLDDPTASTGRDNTSKVGYTQQELNELLKTLGWANNTTTVNTHFVRNDADGLYHPTVDTAKKIVDTLTKNKSVSSPESKISTEELIRQLKKRYPLLALFFKKNDTTKKRILNIFNNRTYLNHKFSFKEMKKIADFLGLSFKDLLKLGFDTRDGAHFFPELRSYWFHATDDNRDKIKTLIDDKYRHTHPKMLTQIEADPRLERFIHHTQDEVTTDRVNISTPSPENQALSAKGFTQAQMQKISSLTGLSPAELRPHTITKMVHGEEITYFKLDNYTLQTVIPKLEGAIDDAKKLATKTQTQLNEQLGQYKALYDFMSAILAKLYAVLQQQSRNI